MIEIYEKHTTSEKDGIEEKSVQVVEKSEANYIHVCGHDTNPPTSCKMVKIK